LHVLKDIHTRDPQLGVTYVEASVVGAAVDPDTREIRSLRAQHKGEDTATTYVCGKVVNAAGPLSSAVIDMLSPPEEFRLPVKPRKRCVFKFNCHTQLKACVEYQ
jgi:glycine/D-amino acid oxidase-like deaminating enzyme